MRPLLTPTSLFVLALSAPAFADGFLSNDVSASLDCTDVSVEYESDPSRTPAEAIEAMDQAFYDSLARFDACQSEDDDEMAATDSGATGSSGGMEGQAGAGSEGAEPEGGGPTGSATAGLTGSTIVGPPEFNDGAADTPSGDQADATSDEDGNTGRAEETRIVNNGRVPADIPSADNDSILEAQIREAAMNEEDPEVRKKLWNEYRKYKGLPVQE